MQRGRIEIACGEAGSRKSIASLHVNGTPINHGREQVTGQTEIPCPRGRQPAIEQAGGGRKQMGICLQRRATAHTPLRVSIVGRPADRDWTR